MGKTVLILSGSPRKGGNSDLLCDEFMRGAQEAGHSVEKIRVAEKKEFYYLVTMADKELESADTTLACFRGYADCVKGAREMGVVVGSGVYEPEKVKNTPAMAEAYEMGKNV